jgi:hypothetical protein
VVAVCDLDADGAHACAERYGRPRRDGDLRRLRPLGDDQRGNL